MICYAVIDTNVLVSALLSRHDDAATVRVVEKIFSGEVIPLYNKDILNEYKEVLQRKKFNFPKEKITVLLDIIEKLGGEVNPAPTNEVLLDSKDLPFYDVATERQNDETYLVTGNMKHFPAKPYIVTVQQFLNILDQR
ncbi:MAG: putative toxin-antitoxin system toxin component, PIN family [Clostridiales bacterium]|nr:putative toxin-antitoxin system toxin component, PIN family [Clostridiales bacterium]